jgi:hypothetical protein
MYNQRAPRSFRIENCGMEMNWDVEICENFKPPERPGTWICISIFCGEGWEHAS